MITKEELTRPIVGIENRAAQEVFSIMCDRITAALAAAEERGRIEERERCAKLHGSMELFGHWSKHRLADGVFLPLVCYVPEGPDYTSVPLYAITKEPTP